MFLVNSRHPLVSATFRCYGGQAPTSRNGRHTFFRSYGVNLPSSLTTCFSQAPWYSLPCPPVSVCGTVSLDINAPLRKLFLEAWDQSVLSRARKGRTCRHHLSAVTIVLRMWPTPTLQEYHPTGLDTTNPPPRHDLPFSVTPSIITRIKSVAQEY